MLIKHLTPNAAETNGNVISFADTLVIMQSQVLTSTSCSTKSQRDHQSHEVVMTFGMIFVPNFITIHPEVPKIFS